MNYLLPKSYAIMINTLNKDICICFILLYFFKSKSKKIHYMTEKKNINSKALYHGTIAPCSQACIND